MKKKFILIPMMLFAIVAFLMVFFIFIRGLSHPYCNNDGVFETCKADFETINNLMLHIESDKERQTFVLTFEEDKTADIFNFPVELSEEETYSLLQTKNAFFGYDYSFIEIAENRIAYGGEGYVMYVYSKDGKKPKYFYHKGDGVKFSTEYLGDNWYYLRTNYR